MQSQEFMKRARDVASYYGFRPLEVVAKEHPESGLHKERRGDRAGVGSACFTPGFRLAEPLFFYYSNESPRSAFERSAGVPQAELNLEIVGTTKSIAEAILLKTALAILEENGVRDNAVYVNGIGDRDSLARFGRDLSAYYRKKIGDLHAPCRTALMKDVFKVVQCDNEKCVILQGEAPRPMNFLTEQGRSHFREVLEYLERMQVSYAVKDFLLGPREFYSKTVFEIRRAPGEGSEEELLASGGRYDDLLRRTTSRRDAAAAGISILFPRRAHRSEPEAKREKRSPKAYFVHLGFEAKLKSLSVLDLLRKARIPVHQALHHDRLAGQLEAAEKLRIPYLIIMGHKEALEDTVIVRDMATRSQETVPVTDIPLYFKTLLHA